MTESAYERARRLSETTKKMHPTWDPEFQEAASKKESHGWYPYGPSGDEPRGPSWEESGISAPDDVHQHFERGAAAHAFADAHIAIADNSGDENALRVASDERGHAWERLVLAHNGDSKMAAKTLSHLFPNLPSIR
jgi:hypothetical protein